MNADELRRARRVAHQRIRQTVALRRAAAASVPNQRRSPAADPPALSRAGESDR